MLKLNCKNKSKRVNVLVNFEDLYVGIIYGFMRKNFKELVEGIGWMLRTVGIEFSYSYRLDC